MDPHKEVEALLAGSDPVNPQSYSDDVREIVHMLFTEMAAGNVPEALAQRLELLMDRVRRYEELRRDELRQRLGALNARRAKQQCLLTLRIFRCKHSLQVRPPRRRPHQHRDKTFCRYSTRLLRAKRKSMRAFRDCKHSSNRRL